MNEMEQRFANQPVYEIMGERATLADGAPFGGIHDAAVSDLLKRTGMAHPLVVTGRHFGDFAIREALDAALPGYTIFSGFSPNPTLGEVTAGLCAYRDGACDGLISIGGGSAIDVAKCIKAFAGAPDADEGSLPAIAPGAMTHIAVPTTAGTGSESTHFAVCYVNGKKASVAHAQLQPDIALLDARTLAGLPAYQKKCTLLDALCQAIESYWSARSSAASRAYSARAIPAIVANAAAYLDGDPTAAGIVMRAANQAGKAINLTTTTAAHAMSYKLTSLYGIPHGHAVALCMPFCWRLLVERGDEQLQRRLLEIAQLACPEATGAADGCAFFGKLIRELDMETTVSASKSGDLDALVSSVNLERFSNFPIDVDKGVIRSAYESIGIMS